MADVTERGNFVFFWSGWPSQWFACRFVLDGVPYNCCEQYMMAEKARIFGDMARLGKIFASRSPREQKALGRKVEPFDAEKWDAVCREVVYRGNLAKFSQNPELKSLLLETGSKTIVEASPLDRIWGIGLAADDSRASDPAQWQGTNWLGDALMRVRDELRSGS
jgi:ribA/ribD-fused uncharacterized protein